MDGNEFMDDTLHRRGTSLTSKTQRSPPEPHIEERWSIHHMEEALVDGPYGSNGLALCVRAFVFVAMRRFVFVFFGFSVAAI